MKIMLQRTLNNERGYIAIFIALVFQVLFIFFAMVVNVGLLVHDKINLQNSVDLAAYYAASKQAEQLNAIAHTNYQIRQSWKLLAWRVRVLGDMGNKGHPLLSDTASPNPQERAINDRYPVVCTAHSYWNTAGLQENFCRDVFSSEAPQFVDPPTIVAPFVLLNFVINDRLARLGDDFRAECSNVGIRNFNIAALWMKAYKLDMYSRTRVIGELAGNLSSSTNDFKDFEGGSVQLGAQKTLEKNLTVSNQGATFTMYNSLGTGQRWLSKIGVVPEIFYLDTTNDNPCTKVIKRCGEIPHFGAGNTTLIERAKFCANPQSQEDPFYSTVGYEKNPWVVAYVGVKATVKGRRPFAPFGGEVELQAQAYAEPFGGRIGPWFEAQWPKGSPRSSGGGFVDQMLPFRAVEEGSSADTRDRRNVMTPNYSRFPGDFLGLKSEFSLGVLRKRLMEDANARLRPAYWALLSDPAVFTSARPDVLAWEGVGSPLRPATDPPTGPWVREFEVAGIMPDLFDATYYSIDPQFLQNYILRPNPYPFPTGVAPRPDLGNRAGTVFENFNIMEQISFQSKYTPPAFYIIKSPSHLLTAWAPNQLQGDSSNYDYSFPDGEFANCKGSYKATGTQTPGGCLDGARVGYSVRLISGDFLKSDKAVDGGGGITGPPDNPPPF